MVQNTWSIFLDLAPWLLIGMAVAGLLHVLLPAGLVKRELQGRWGVLKAVSLGIPLPLCSCGVIPAGLGLKRDGASDGASVGFMISTPQTGVDSILVCVSFLGWPFTVFKVLTAGVTGVLGGWLTEGFGGPRLELESEELSAVNTQPGWRDGLNHALSVLQTIWGWLVVGVLVSAAIQTWLPPSVFQQTQELGGMATSMGVLLISLPIYVCATASVPIAAALVSGGMPVGAALVFLMAGPATNVATMGAILRGFGRRILVIYLGTIIVCSVGAAEIFNRWVDPVWSQQMSHGDHGGPWATVSALVLIGLLCKFALEDLRRFRAASVPMADGAMDFKVEGMTCGGCVSRLEGVLRGVEGVEDALVTLEPGRARVQGSVAPDRIESAIRDAGFSIGS